MYRALPLRSWKSQRDLSVSVGDRNFLLRSSLKGMGLAQPVGCVIDVAGKLAMFRRQPDSKATLQDTSAGHLTLELHPPVKPL